MMSGSAFRTSVFGAWLLTSFILIIAAYPSLAAWRFPDPDDQLRLLQVRDWLGGQSWFDVTQYRMNAPLGGAMHWSRFVDIPIAAVIILVTPLFGTAYGETAALVIVPLLTLGIVMALVATLTRRLLDHQHAILATFLVPMCVEVTHQLRPMRIDHHGWQMALALVIMCGLLDVRVRRGGMIAGLALGLWLSISLEGLPFAVLTMALLGLRWAFDREQGARLNAATLTLAFTAPVFYAVTHQASQWGLFYCDAVSAVHLAVFAAAGAGSFSLVRIAPKQLMVRLAGLAALAVGCAALLLMVAPSCAAGPFTALDPLVYDFWYVRIMEGLPIWHQTPSVMAFTLALPLLAIGGTVAAIVRSTGETRVQWGGLLFMLAGATIIAVLVQRASGVANLLALPPASIIVLSAVKWARSFDRALPRMVATLAAALLAAPGLVAANALQLVSNSKPEVVTRNASLCLENDEISKLAVLRAGNVMAPLDASPSILLETQHRIVASSHHRNHAAMHDVIATFIGTAEEARVIIAKRRIDYVVVCPGQAETTLYKLRAPDGFWAQIDAGQLPTWLVRVKVKGMDQLKVWRVKPAETSNNG